ncbi:hypothetical protein SFRURICE_019724 [Spodoptera frugiperda]|nr:hypothetical protein SFRURICE_019724 [Spodoptera frugiperda]
MIRLLLLAAAAIVVRSAEEESMKNLTTITWAHAVNNKTYLQASLASTICMLEADIVIGTVVGKEGPAIPIMAHPPATTSDLSLAEFLETVSQHNLKESNPTSKKGVKLDFKSIEAYEESQELIGRYQAQGLPIWLNADILPGPVDATTKPVDPVKFLKLGSKHACAVLSVRAGLAANSQPVLLDLLRETSSLNSTMTVWSSEGDHVEVDRLRALILTVGLERTYLDVPQELAGKLHLPPPDAKAKN